MQTAYFEWLASEQVSLVLSNLQAEDLAWASAVCRDWVEQNLLWRALVLQRWPWIGGGSGISFPCTGMSWKRCYGTLAKKLTTATEREQRKLLRGLQLTREFLRTLQYACAPCAMQVTHYLVRLNAGALFGDGTILSSLFTAAQIVHINGDEVEVCGVDKLDPLYVARVSVAFVSNAPLKDEELTDVMSKLRLGVITDLPVGQAEEMAAVRRAVMVHPQYVAARQAQRPIAPPRLPGPPLALGPLQALLQQQAVGNLLLQHADAKAT